jgi:hypothetical protein
MQITRPSGCHLMKSFRERTAHKSVGKMMLTIVWNLNGFRGINVLSKEIKFNADHYITDVLIPLAEWRKTHIDRIDRKLLVYTDNALSHIAKKCFDFLEQNEIENHLTHRIHLV